MGNLDSAYEDFHAAASVTTEAPQYAWVTGEAQIALGHCLAKYQSAGETRTEIAACAQNFMKDPEAVSRYRERALQVTTSAGVVRRSGGNDAVATASLVQLRHSPVKSGSVEPSMPSVERSVEPSMSPTPRTPKLSPHVSRFLLCDLTNAHKKAKAGESSSPSQEGSIMCNTPAAPVPHFNEKEAGEASPMISPMLLDSRHAKSKDCGKEKGLDEQGVVKASQGSRGETRGRKNLLKQAMARNSRSSKKRPLEEKEEEMKDAGMDRAMLRRRTEVSKDC